VKIWAAATVVWDIGMIVADSGDLKLLELSRLMPPLVSSSKSIDQIMMPPCKS
jgi:hypothetical protein